MAALVRVLVVDDSAYVRKSLKQLLSRSPFLEVVGTARDGQEALELVELLKPDVVTLDLNMPGMDGLAFLRKQMASRPLPVVVVSFTEESGEPMLNALQAGAVEIVQKPTALANERVFEIADELVSKIKGAAEARISRFDPVSAPVQAIPQSPASATGAFELIVLGVSTGGPQALKYLIPRLPSDLPVPLAMVVHMPVGYTEPFARSLNEISQLEVAEAREGGVLRPGSAILGRAGYHLRFRRSPTKGITAHLDLNPRDTQHRPAVDVLFQSAAENCRNHVLGIVMTGMGSDGVRGASWIKAQGGMVFSEAEETCVVYGMPRSVVEAGLSDKVVPLHEMASVILESL